MCPNQVEFLHIWDMNTLRYSAALASLDYQFLQAEKITDYLLYYLIFPLFLWKEDWQLAPNGQRIILSAATQRATRLFWVARIATGELGSCSQPSKAVLNWTQQGLAPWAYSTSLDKARWVFPIGCPGSVAILHLRQRVSENKNISQGLWKKTEHKVSSLCLQKMYKVSK